jgi:hypothetical protein
LDFKTHTVLICLGFLFESLSLSAQSESAGAATTVSPIITESSIETPSTNDTEVLQAIEEKQGLDSLQITNEGIILLPVNSEVSQRKNPVSSKGILENRLTKNSSIIDIETKTPLK